MIPLIAIVRIRHDGKSGFSLWIPLVLIWLLLLPFALLLSPFALIYCVFKRINPFKAVAALFGLLNGLTGTRIEVENARSSVYVVVR
jgi:hypothetical protein